VASETARTYIALLGLNAQLQQAKATSTSRTEALRLAQEKFEAGYISQLELTQAQSELEAVEQHIPQLELAISRHHNALRLLSGELPAAYEQNAPSTLTALVLPAPGAGLPSELLRRRPDIARAELGLASRDASLEASRAAFLPQVSLSARAGALYVSALSYDPTKIWSLGGSILAPIFDRGRLQAQFDSATAQRDEAAFAYRGVVLTAFSEVENALAGQGRFAEELSHVTARRDVLKRSLEHARNRYEAGYASYLEQLDAQRNLYEAENQVIAVRESQLQNMVDLYKALGGGWDYEKVMKRE
jgi:NodT family efflux transporter outer membrane factor (OMF) lipoprotein